MNPRVGFLKGLKKWKIFSYLTRKKWERNKKNKVRYKRGRVTNITKIQKNYENLRQQIGQHRRNEQISRDKHLPRMKQEETDNLHRPITNT